MIYSYPACFYKEKEGGYSVIFHDISACTCGDTLQEAREMAIDCMALHIYSVKADGLELSAPSDIADIDINEHYDDYESAFIELVSVDVDKYAKEHFDFQ